jgi:cation transport ATPase
MEAWRIELWITLGFGMYDDLVIAHTNVAGLAISKAINLMLDPKFLAEGGYCTLTRLVLACACRLVLSLPTTIQDGKQL